MPCTLGELAPGALKTVIASFAFTSGAPRQASVQFRISGGTPAPADRDAVTTALATHATGCSSTGTGPGGALALLAVVGWTVRRRPRTGTSRSRSSPTSAETACIDRMIAPESWPRSRSDDGA
jgi:uncharacterized protein (TIGR03382 family)